MGVRMYAGKNSLIKVPESSEKGRIIIYKNNYVYLVIQCNWDKQEKKKIEKRVIIGKIDPRNKDMMYPNTNYDYYFQSSDEEVDLLKVFYGLDHRIEAGKYHFTISYGPYYILMQSAIKCGMFDALQRSMPDIAHKIFAVAMHAVLRQDSTAQDFRSWVFNNYCGINIPSSDSDISKLYRTIDENQEGIKIFFELYRKNFFTIFPQYTERVCAFDSTNQVTESTNQQKAKYGKAK